MQLKPAKSPAKDADRAVAVLKDKDLTARSDGFHKESVRAGLSVGMHAGELVVDLISRPKTSVPNKDITATHHGEEVLKFHFRHRSLPLK